MSSEMKWEYRLVCQHDTVECFKAGEEIELEPLWWCATEKCDGAGFGFDIFPVKTMEVG